MYDIPFSQSQIAISVGGDNYCYDDHDWLMVLNRKARKQNVKTVLWGCSVEPKILKDEEVIEDMKQYSLIMPRESITYQALIDNGITKNIKLFPDPAFLLEKTELPLPKGFLENNTIGINISPLVIRCETKKDVTMDNYVALLQHIIDTTDMQIALIPHVVWDDNDDRKPLKKLYEKFKATGRVVMIDDHNCMELKGFISRLRMFIGTRTHAIIAAYSSCVPTLAVGYSVKAKGIAKDIFDTYDNYVIPVQTLENRQDLVNAFEWLKDNEESIRQHLEEFMPSYCEKTSQAADEIHKLM